MAEKREGRRPSPPRGYALMTVLVIGALFVALTWAVASEVVMNQSATKARLGTSRARFAAYSGLHHAIYHLKKTPDFGGELGPFGMPDNDNLSYGVEITNNRSGATTVLAPDGTEVPPHTIYCAAMGVDNENQSVALHAITGLLSQQPPQLQYSTFSDHSIDFQGSSESLSFDPAESTFTLGSDGRVQASAAKANGHIGSNRYIALLGSSTVQGDVYRPAAAAAATQILTSNLPTGSILDLPMPVSIPKYTAPADALTVLELPDNPPSLMVSQTGATGVFDKLRVTDNSTVEVGPGEYFFPNGIELDGTLQPASEVDPTRPIVFFSGDDVTLGSSARINPAGESSLFQLYFVDQGSQANPPRFTMVGNSQFFGTVVGNQVEGLFEDNAELYGGFLGRTVRATGSAKLYFDESLNGTPLQVAGGWGLNGVTEPKPEKLLLTGTFVARYVTAVREGSASQFAPVSTDLVMQQQTATQ